MPRDRYDVIISGMGSAGLSCAFAAASQGKSVLIVTNRDNEFSRVQRVGLDVNSRELIKSMCSGEVASTLSLKDQKCLTELNQTGFIAIKDLEAFIYHRLTKFETLIDYTFYSELSSIDLHAGIAQITTQETNETSNIAFTYLVGADGVNHHSCNLINHSDDPEIHIKYIPDLSESPGIQLYPYHMSAYLMIKRTDGGFLDLQSNMILTEQTDLYFNTHKRTAAEIKCNFVSQLPSEIIGIQDQRQKLNAALQYARESIFEQLNNGSICSHTGELSIELTKPSRNPKKDALKLLFFEIHLLQANRAAVESQGHYFLLVGDAFRTPNYKQGTGMNYALEHARLFYQLMSHEVKIDELNTRYASIVFNTHFNTTFSLPFTSRDQFTLAMSELLENHSAQIILAGSYFYDRILAHPLCNEDTVMLICRLCDEKNTETLQKVVGHSHATDRVLALAFSKSQDLHPELFNSFVQMILSNSNVGPVTLDKMRENGRANSSLIEDSVINYRN